MIGQLMNPSSLQYVKEGLYHYHFIVDGKIRFSPDQPSAIDHDQKIVNYLEIDNYMINKAEEERDQQNNVINMADFLAIENSWKLSENFMRNCREKG